MQTSALEPHVGTEAAANRHRRRRTGSRDRQTAIAILAMLVVVYVLIRVSLAEADLSPKTFADVNELTQNISLTIAGLGVCLGVNAPRK